MYLIDMISYWAKADPHRLALIQPELVTTYQGLADAIDAMAERIERLNLDRREPIGVAIANPSYCVAAACAALRCGYSVALVRSALFPLLSSAGIRNLIYDAEGLMLSGGRNIRFDPAWVTGAQRSDAKPARRWARNDDLDIIFFTSGTTGLPKKVIQPLAALDRLLEYPLTCASGAGDKILIMAGLSTTLGFNRLCEVLNAGKTACFASSSASALALIGLHRIDVAVVSASQAVELAKTKNSNPDHRLESLKALFVGGGTIGPEGVSIIRATLCRNAINQYGSTEAGVAALTPFQALDNKPGAIPLPWTELQIVDEAGQQLPPGAEGLIRYRTPQLRENIKRAGSDAVPGVRGEWFYPGDVGTLTSDGVLRFAGRRSDVINRGGVKVSGSRIEEVLKTMPEVKDAAACGVAGPSGLEEIWIAIVPNDSIDVAEVHKLLLGHAEIGAAPDEVFLLDELPRGELGKVQMVRLREMLLSRKKAA